MQRKCKRVRRAQPQKAAAAAAAQASATQSNTNAEQGGAKVKAAKKLKERKQKQFVLDEEDEGFREEVEEEKFSSRKLKQTQRYATEELRPAYATRGTDREARMQRRNAGEETAKTEVTAMAKAAKMATAKKMAKAAKAEVATARTLLVKARAAIAGEAPEGIHTIWLKAAPRRKTLLRSDLTQTWMDPNERRESKIRRRLLRRQGTYTHLAEVDSTVNIISAKTIDVWTNDVLAKDDQYVHLLQSTSSQMDTDIAVRDTFSSHWRFS